MPLDFNIIHSLICYERPLIDNSFFIASPEPYSGNPEEVANRGGRSGLRTEGTLARLRRHLRR